MFIRQECRKRIFVIMCIVAGMNSANFSSAATLQWKSGDTTHPEDWHSAKNWDTGSVPVDGDSVDVKASTMCKISGGKSAVVNLLRVGNRSKGTMSILDKGSSLTASDIYIGGFGGPGKGTFTQSGGTIITNVLCVDSWGALSYGKYYGTGGKLTVNGNLSCGGGGPTIVNVGNGWIQIDGTDVSVAKTVFNGSGRINGLGPSNGTISITAGSLRVGKDFYNALHSWSKTLPQGKKHYGRLIISGGSVDITDQFYNGFGSDPSQSEAILEVIGSRGKITIGGDFTLIPGSTLIAELAGKAHTVICVNGNVALGGAFKVRLSKGYKPTSETWWDIVRVTPSKPGSFNGAFSKLDFSEVGGSKNWKVQYNSDDCVFRVGYIPDAP